MRITDAYLAPPQHVLDLGDVEPARGEQDVEVVDEVGRLLDDALVALVERRDGQLDRLLAHLARAGADARARAARPCTSPAGLVAARSAIVRQSPGAKHETLPGVARRPRRRHAQRAARRRRSRRAAPRPRACCRRSRPCARAARASGSRTTPRPSRACGARPPRPSRRASARGPVAASCTIAGFSSGCIADSRRARAARRAATTSRVGILVQDRREQRRLRDLERLGDVLRGARAARGDHRESNRGGDRRRQLQVVAGARAVGVDRREQDLARAALLRLARPLDGVAGPSASCRRASARGRRRRRSRPRPPASRAARPARSTSSGRSSAAELTATLSAPAASSASRVGERAHAAADRERDREPLGDARARARRASRALRASP